MLQDLYFGEAVQNEEKDDFFKNIRQTVFQIFREKFLNIKNKFRRIENEFTREFKENLDFYLSNFQEELEKY